MVVVAVGSTLRSLTIWGWNSLIWSGNSGSLPTIWDTTATSTRPMIFQVLPPSSAVSVMMMIGSFSLPWS